MVRRQHAIGPGISAAAIAAIAAAATDNAAATAF
jgi:hypothetical protein